MINSYLFSTIIFILNINYSKLAFTGKDQAPIEYLISRFDQNLQSCDVKDQSAKVAPACTPYTHNTLVENYFLNSKQFVNMRHTYPDLQRKFGIVEGDSETRSIATRIILLIQLLDHSISKSLDLAKIDDQKYFLYIEELKTFFFIFGFRENWFDEFKSVSATFAEKLNQINFVEGAQLFIKTALNSREKLDAANVNSDMEQQRRYAFFAIRSLHFLKTVEEKLPLTAKNDGLVAATTTTFVSNAFNFFRKNTKNTVEKNIHPYQKYYDLSDDIAGCLLYRTINSANLRRKFRKIHKKYEDEDDTTTAKNSLASSLVKSQIKFEGIDRDQFEKDKIEEEEMRKQIQAEIANDVLRVEEAEKLRIKNEELLKIQREQEEKEEEKKRQKELELQREQELIRRKEELRIQEEKERIEAEERIVNERLEEEQNLKNYEAAKKISREKTFNGNPEETVNSWLKKESDKLAKYSDKLRPQAAIARINELLDPIEKKIKSLKKYSQEQETLIDYVQLLTSKFTKLVYSENADDAIEKVFPLFNDDSEEALKCAIDIVRIMFDEEWIPVEGELFNAEVVKLFTAQKKVVDDLKNKLKEKAWLK